MTARRQKIKEQWLQLARITAIVVRGIVLSVVSSVVLTVGLGTVAGSSARAQTTERLVVDHFTGLVLGGTDPVAYFTDGQVVQGSPDFELSAMGAVWRFSNADNRAFFVAMPQVYAPRFGGYDPVDVARGVAVAGVPRLWLIHAERLYLFAREDSRDAFAANPDGVLRAADARWPALRDGLVQ